MGYTLAMRLYPVFLSLADSRVLVVGAGKVGRRKVAGLCDAGTKEIFVFDPGLSDAETKTLLRFSGVRVFQRTVTENDLKECVLVFAATNDPTRNRELAALCKERNIFCNVVDDPDCGSFHVPASTRVEELTIAFSTGGKSPALAAHLRRESELWIERDYSSLLILLRRLRPIILNMDNNADRHGEIFRSLVNSGLGQALARTDRPEASRILTALLPPSLHDRIEELLHVLC